MRKALFILCLFFASHLTAGCLVPYCGDGECDPCGTPPSCDCSGYWFPESPQFTSFVADPRRVSLSVGWRLHDDLFADDTGPVSFGDYVGLYRWCRPWGLCGNLQIGIEGNIYAIFEQTRFSSPLVNADYYVAFPLSYECGCWEYRLRFYHISSHIGDEFLINHPNFCRLNPSSEYIDLFTSYRGISDLRLYAGVGYIVRSDETFKFDKFYAQFGFEYYPTMGRYYLCDSHVIMRPFIAAHEYLKEDNDYNHDMTIAVGYEWFRDYCCPSKKVRLFYEYHHGNSFEGQFARQKTDYQSVTITYGY